jgi:DNA-directed RNA polymerase subunit omega
VNSELVKQALQKVGNPYDLVNLVSSRVRQLNAGRKRSLLGDTGQMGVADIALREIVEEKMGWEIPQFIALTRPVGRRRKKW